MAAVKERKNRTTEERVRDRAEMAHLIARGYNKTMAAEKMGLRVKQIEQDWSVVRQQTKNDYVADPAEAIAIRARQYAEILREAYEQWDLSKQPPPDMIEDDSPTIMEGDD